MNPLLVVLALSIPPAQVVDSIATQIENRYVLVQEAPRIAAQLRAKTYEDSLTEAQLAQKIGEDLRAISGDIHFDVRFDPEHATRPPTVERDRMRRTNYGFRRVETLGGNVALIDMTRFEDLKDSRSTASAAMAFAANADAVIFDLRENPGGHGNTVNFLVSHFVAGDAELMSSFDRETGKTERGHALKRIPGQRRTDVPLFVVIGNGTGSAAEAFAFTLQQIGRATIVGEHSAGAAQGGDWFPAAGGFVAFIPTFRPFNPKTGKNWHGSGVQPDITIPAARALDAAHLQAVKALDAKASRHELRWLVPLLELAVNGPAKPAIDGATGRYEGIEIALVDGTLRFLGAAGVWRDMTPLSDGTFLIEDASVAAVHRARLRFTTTGLELLTESGRVIARPRLAN